MPSIANDQLRERSQMHNIHQIRVNDDNFIYSTMYFVREKIATSKKDPSDLQSLSTSLLGYKTHSLFTLLSEDENNRRDVIPSFQLGSKNATSKKDPSDLQSLRSELLRYES